jgi:molecular chaperone DnaJ
LSGRGAPTSSGAYGDLIVEVKLVLPTVADERSKELMREFGRLNSEDVRRDLHL